jgi:hypothetical protein
MGAARGAEQTTRPIKTRPGNVHEVFMREGLGDAPRATRGSVGRVAAGGSVQPRTQMPPGLHGHRLQYNAQKSRKFMS